VLACGALGGYVVHRLERFRNGAQSLLSAHASESLIRSSPMVSQVLTSVEATVHHVLPKVGLAYLVDDRDVEWAVTKATKGLGIEQLRPGQRVRLILDHYPSFSLVRQYLSVDRQLS
jgi:hypothetical protein